MSKNARRKNHTPAGDTVGESAETRRLPAFRPPLAPSRRRLVIASILLAVWVGVLLALYVTAVLPEKQKKQSQGRDPATIPATTVTPATPSLPSGPSPAVPR
jgi:hypothetical protein